MRGKHVGHHLFFGWGGGLQGNDADSYIDWLWNKWRTMPKRVDPAELKSTTWDSDKTRRKLVVDAPRPRKPGRRQSTGGQNY